LRRQKRLAKVMWNGPVVELVPFYRVSHESFELEKIGLLGDGKGRALHGHPVHEKHSKVFASLVDEPLSYRELSKRLKKVDGAGFVDQLILHLFEEDFLVGYDKEGQHVPIRGGLRFGGVGAGDDLS
jgi:hypothetical protein